MKHFIWAIRTKSWPRSDDFDYIMQNLLSTFFFLTLYLVRFVSLSTVSTFYICTECWGRVSKGFSPYPDLNCRPLDYETSVITTTPRKLRFSLEKKLQFSWFLHFSWNLVWFRSFKNLEQKMGAIFFLKWLKWIEPACFPPWKKFWNQILYYSFC